MNYYSTFVPGLLEPVQYALTQTLPDCKVHLALDGLIAYESNADLEEIRGLSFVTNTFHILKSFPRQPGRTIRNMALQVLSDRALSIKIVPPPERSGTFRVITSLANQLVPLDAGIMRDLEKRITAQTGLVPNRSKPDYEIWLLQRTEGHGFFSVRLSRHKAYDKLLQKGELRPELANVLCRLSEPCADELFLDPFCGSGAIPIQRAKFPKGLIIASDNNQQKIDLLKQRVKDLDLKKRIVVRCENALDLGRYGAGSIHKIVTDPPWGHFEATEVALEEFYDRMMAEFGRLLIQQGRLVVVTAQTAAFESAAGKAASQFDVIKRFNILLSGKKAVVYVLARK